METRPRDVLYFNVRIFTFYLFNDIHPVNSPAAGSLLRTEIGYIIF
jgi:hypothetical protein